MDGADAHAVRLSLSAAARELERIADLGRDVQDALSPVLRSLAASSPVEAQALDALVQQADGVAQFLDALALQCADDWRVDGDQAVAGLGLAAQRRRLQGGEPGPSTAADAESEIELF
jgi:hypothetical protein